MGLESIVNVQISRLTTAVTQAGFGTVLIVGTTATFTDRIRFYSNLAGVATDFATTSPEYLAASAAFAQTPSPTQVAIGKKAVGDADWPTALNAIQAASDNWYGLVITSKVAADILAVAGWVEAQRKIFAAASADAAVIAAGSGDIASSLNLGNYARTALVYTGTATQYPGAALLGKMLPYTPGSATAKFKTLAGITSDALSTTQSTTARGKNANTYETLAGVSIIQDGKVAVGEWLDIIIGIDWLQARMQERIYSRLVNLNKVPFTDEGGAIIEAEIRAQLRQAVDNKFLTADYTVTIPAASSLSPNDRASRIWSGITFNAHPAGAVHVMNINGTVTV